MESRPIISPGATPCKSGGPPGPQTQGCGARIRRGVGEALGGEGTWCVGEKGATSPPSRPVCPAGFSLHPEDTTHTQRPTPTPQRIPVAPWTRGEPWNRRRTASETSAPGQPRSRVAPGGGGRQGRSPARALSSRGAEDWDFVGQLNRHLISPAKTQPSTPARLAVPRSSGCGAPQTVSLGLGRPATRARYSAHGLGRGSERRERVP